MVADESKVNQNTKHPCLECKMSWALALGNGESLIWRSAWYTKPIVERESSLVDIATVEGKELIEYIDTCRLGEYYLLNGIL